MSGACPKCAGNRAELRNAAYRNERRAAAGKPPLLDDIERAKERIATCTAAGHRRQSEIAHTNP